jgi:uncharacterized protein
MPAHARNPNPTRLLMAVEANNPQRVAELLKLGDNPNARVGERSLLAYALGAQRDAAALALIEGGASATDQQGPESPLSCAIRFLPTGRALPIVLALIERGADLNAPNDEGEPPLHCAMSHFETGVALALIEAGADLETLDLTGHSPLARAVCMGHAKLTEELLRRGANPWFTDPEGADLLDMAREMKALYGAQWDLDPAVIVAAREAASIALASGPEGQAPARPAAPRI